MIRRYPWFLLLLLGTGRCLGQLRIGVSTGYEREDFHWSIAGNSAGQDPNVYSELKWRNAGGFFTRGELQWTVRKRWRVFANGSRTFVHSGSMTDTDYGLDNRHDVLYRQQFPVAGGYAESGSAGVGYALLDKGCFGLTLLVGYGISKQSFPVTDAGGPFAGLNSFYAGKWLGPFARVEGVWRLAAGWQVEAAVRYDQVVYRGVADWNLIADFQHPLSFKHRADGYGVTGELGLSYVIGRHWVFSLRAGGFDWETGTGIDELYLASGGTQQTRLNAVVRMGFEGGLGVDWRF
jgi:Protochlamydia outer membrane protein